MQSTLTALAVVTVGYVMAYLVFDRLRIRFGYAGGAEYVLLGFFFGPKMSGLLTAEALMDLTPLVSLAIGWLGMALGSYFRLGSLVNLDSVQLRMAFTVSTVSFLLALGVLLPFTHFVVALPWTESAVLATTLAAIATVSAPAAIDAFGSDPGRRAHPLFPVLQLAARTNGLVGVVGFGILMAVFHRGEAALVREPTSTEWAVINIAVGVASGLLFHLFLGPRSEWEGEDGKDRLFVALAAAIVIASGASYYLNLSPIYTNLILGFILANTGRAHEAARQLLTTTERPVYLALLIFAGAAWTGAEATLLYVAPLFVGLRLLARLGAGFVAGTYDVPEDYRSPRFGRALLAQGGIAVGIALTYGQVYPEVFGPLVLTATLLSVLLFELVAAAETSRFLRPSDVVEPEPRPALGEGAAG